MDAMERRLAKIAQIGLQAGQEQAHGAARLLSMADSALFKLPLHFDDPSMAPRLIAEANRVVYENRSPIFDEIDCRASVGESMHKMREMIDAGRNRFAYHMAAQKEAFELAFHAATIGALYRNNPGVIQEDQLHIVLKEAENSLASVANLLAPDMPAPRASEPMPVTSETQSAEGSTLSRT